MVGNCRLGDARQRADSPGNGVETLAPVQEGLPAVADLVVNGTVRVRMVAVQFQNGDVRLW